MKVFVFTACIILITFFTGCSVKGYSPTFSGAETDIDQSNEKYMAGVHFARSGNLKKALKYFYQAEDLDPDNKSILRDISLANYQLGKYKASLEYADKVLSLSEYDYSALLRKAFIYQNLDDYENSISSYSTILKYKPDDHVALANIANIEFENKNYKESMEYVSRFEAAVEAIVVSDLSEQGRNDLIQIKNSTSFIKGVMEKTLSE